MTQQMADIRKEYRRGHLREDEVDPDPFALFADWLEQAKATGLIEPNAMTLATVNGEGHPSARMMLLKSFDTRGFEFYTNYTGRKAGELAANPWAAMTFWWPSLERQVRIEGVTEKVSAAESDDYYNSRPKGSRLGAWVSHQSSIIPDRSVLEARHAELTAEYADREPERPPFWGGYRLTPVTIEFWQGGVHRLHDRLRYRREEGSAWIIERLSP